MSRNLKYYDFEPQFVFFNIFAFAKLSVACKPFLYALTTMYEEIAKNEV